ncbi:MAG TPA: hypothetical protein VHC19_28625 [Pirellulales bacterium]|nr:hypothetical protein [Pirellulales bacterium]
MKTLHRIGAAALLTFWATSALADERAPSWTLVPETTLLVARVPGGGDFLAALRRQTKLGSVVLTEARLRRAFELWREENKESWEEIAQGLGQHGLKLEDWPKLLEKEAGFALVAEPRGNRAPLFIGLTWLEPGEDLAERLVKAVQSVVEEISDEPGAPRRMDLELAGHEVMHLAVPIKAAEPLDAESLFSGDDDELSQEKVQELIKRHREKLRDRKQIDADRVHVLAARLGRRLLIANTFSQSSAEVLAKDEEARRDIDWDKLTGIEEATGVFARFLAAHDGQAEGAGRAAQLLAAPGLAGALPEGTVLAEAFGDLKPLLELAALHGDGKAAKSLATWGIDSLGALAVRIALDGNALRIGAFVSAPEPRAGALSLIDQTPLPPEPPEWVPTGILEFQQFSFDLGEVYARFKELSLTEEGERAVQTFNQMEQAVQGTLQTDLATLLSSVGRRHIAIEFPPKHEPEPQDDEAKAAVAAFSQRVGMVWQVKDEQVWNRVMQVIGQFAPAAGGAVEAAEEQGFKGFRLHQGPLEIGLFFGRGYLVLGVGSEVTESLLSVLRTPPTGDASLRTSGLVERGRALLAPVPGLLYQISDAGLDVKSAKQGIERLIDLSLTQPKLPGSPFGAAALAGEDSAASKALAARIKALLPSDSELEGVLGVSVTQASASPNGLLLQSAVELPAP